MESRSWIDRVRSFFHGQSIACDMLTACSHVRTAAWTPEKKQEIIDKVRKDDIHLVDHKLFDGYDLTLWKMVVPSGEFVYMIGLNSNNYSPFDSETVSQNQPGTTLNPKQNLQLGIDAIQEWSSQYGKLLIGTANERKSKSYVRLISRSLGELGFKLQEANPGDFTMGYFLIPPGQ